MRSQIRLREGRAKPIDVLWRNLAVEEDFDEDMPAPDAVFVGLTSREIEELAGEIAAYQQLDTEQEWRRDFWAALRVVAEQELQDCRQQEAVDRARIRGEAPPPQAAAGAGRLHRDVGAEVASMLAGKDARRLQALHDQISAQIASGEASRPCRSCIFLVYFLYISPLIHALADPDNKPPLTPR